jgi:hypothetical protein
VRPAEIQVAFVGPVNRLPQSLGQSIGGGLNDEAILAFRNYLDYPFQRIFPGYLLGMPVQEGHDLFFVLG